MVRLTINNNADVIFHRRDAEDAEKNMGEKEQSHIYKRIVLNCKTLRSLRLCGE